MSLNRQSVSRLSSIAYNLQPGDATSYTFVISFLERSSSQVFSGVGQNPEADYFFLSIQMSGGSGCGILGLDLVKLLRDDLGSSSYTLGYASGHGFGAVNSYTLAAVLLACSVLLDNPDDLHQACEQMLRASELLRAF